MMKTPTEFQLAHMFNTLYDPQKAHEYYLRTRKLKGRKKGAAPPPVTSQTKQGHPPHRKPKGQLSPREQQKVALKQSIQGLEIKLHNLEALIKKKEATLANDQQLAKSKANQNAKSKGSKPQTAAEKAKAAKQYRDAHKQQLKNKAKQGQHKQHKGQAHKKGQTDPKKNKQSIANLKALATKVKGQLALAKQKLAAL
jgi:hypothetical protein